jgi:hypothetical protein
LVGKEGFRVTEAEALARLQSIGDKLKARGLHVDMSRDEHTANITSPLGALVFLSVVTSNSETRLELATDVVSQFKKPGEAPHIGKHRGDITNLSDDEILQKVAGDLSDVVVEVFVGAVYAALQRSYPDLTMVEPQSYYFHFQRPGVEAAVNMNVIPGVDVRVYFKPSRDNQQQVRTFSFSPQSVEPVTLEIAQWLRSRNDEQLERLLRDG